jgi:hypothetical protein
MDDDTEIAADGALAKRAVRSSYSGPAQSASLTGLRSAMLVDLARYVAIEQLLVQIAG